MHVEVIKLSKFLHGRRSTTPLRTDFTQQSSPRSSHGLLRKTNLCRAFLQQEVSHRFMFTHKTYCLFNCWLYGIGIRFSPNNLKRKARCGSDFLEYVQVNKILQKLRKRKVCKHLKVLPREVFQNRQACHQLQSGPCSIFAPIKSLFHQSKTWIYSKMFTTSVQTKTSPLMGYLLYRNIYKKNRGSEIENGK